jgi:hypothetical protein
MAQMTQATVQKVTKAVPEVEVTKVVVQQFIAEWKNMKHA